MSSVGEMVFRAGRATGGIAMVLTVALFILATLNLMYRILT